MENGPVEFSLGNDKINFLGGGGDREGNYKVSQNPELLRVLFLKQ